MTYSELLAAAEYVRDNGGYENAKFDWKGNCTSSDADDEFIEAAKKLAEAWLHLTDDSLLFGLPIYDSDGVRITKSDLLESQ